MKFSCSKCETKYSIADEIVRGKAVKVRCKKCGNINIVREQKPEEPRGEEPTRAVTLDPGMLASLRTSLPNQGAATGTPAPASASATPRPATAGVASQPAATARTPPQRMQTGTNIPVARGPVVRPAPTGASMLAAAAPKQNVPPPVEEWYLAIKGQQVGPMSFPDVESRLSRGEVDARTYGWRDGMGDWKRLQDIPEFRPLLVKPAAPPPPPAPPPVPNAAGAQVVDLQAEIARRKRSQAPTGDFADAPTVRNQQPSASEGLSSLIDEAAKDLGAPDHDPFAAAGGEPTPAKGSPVAAAAADPFAGVQDSAHTQDGPPRESTRMFIAAAGLANRGRKQKIYAGVASLVVGLLGTVIYLDASGIYQIPIVSELVDVGFAALDVEPPVKRRVVEDDGSGGDYGFLGIRKPKPAKPKARPAGAPGDTGGGGTDLAAALAGASNNAGGTTFERKGDEAVDTGAPVSNTAQSEALKALLNSPDKKKVEVVNPGLGKGAVDVKAQGTMGTKAVDTPLSPEQIGKVVADQKSSLNQCANEAAKMGEKYKGTMKVTVTIGPSGKVKKVTVMDPKHAQTRLGECLGRALMRWPFPRFQGEEFDAELPLKLTVGQ